MGYYTEEQIKAGVEHAVKKFKGKLRPALTYIKNFDKQLHRELKTENLLDFYFPPDKLEAYVPKVSQDTSQISRILAWFKSQKEVGGTCGDVAQATGIVRSSITGRVKELRVMGCLEVVGSPTHTEATLYVYRSDFPSNRNRRTIVVPQRLRAFRPLIRNLIVAVLTEKPELDISPLTEEVIARHLPLAEISPDEMRTARKNVNSAIWNMLRSSGNTPPVLHGTFGADHTTSNIHMAKKCKNPRCVVDSQETSRVILRRRLETPSKHGFVTGLYTECQSRGLPAPEVVYKKIVDDFKQRAVCLVKIQIAQFSLIEGIAEIDLKRHERDGDEIRTDVKKRLKDNACKDAFHKLTDYIKVIPKVDNVSL